MKVFCAAFSFLNFIFVIFCQNEISAAFMCLKTVWVQDISGKAARKMFVKLTADWSDGQRLLHGRPGPREVPCRLLPVSSAEVGHPNLVT